MRSNPSKHVITKLIITTVAAICIHSTWANPPYITIDPTPADFKHTDSYLYTSLVDVKAATTINAPGLEIDYGILPDIEINTILSYLYNSPSNHTGKATAAYGFTDAMLGAVFRFVKESRYLPQFSFVPTYVFPTGDVRQSLGFGKPYVELPFALSKSWGSLAGFANVGYALVNNKQMQNFYFGSVLLQKTVTDKWSYGGEIYSQNAGAPTNVTTTVLNVGTVYNFTKTMGFFMSIGHNICGEQETIATAGFALAV